VCGGDGEHVARELDHGELEAKADAQERLLVFTSVSATINRLGLARYWFICLSIFVCMYVCIHLYMLYDGAGALKGFLFSRAYLKRTRLKLEHLRVIYTIHKNTQIHKCKCMYSQKQRNTDLTRVNAGSRGGCPRRASCFRERTCKKERITHIII